MRLATSATVALLAASVAGELTARDLGAVENVITQVTANVEALDTAVNSFNGSIQSVVAASETLISSITNGTQTVDDSSQLSSEDAYNLLSPIYTLQTKGEALASDLKCQRPAIEKSSLCSQTREQVTKINTVSQALVKAAIAKIPNGLQSMSTQLSQSLTDELNSVQDYFSESNCKDGGSDGNGTATAACSVSSGVATTTSSVQSSSSPTATSSSSSTSQQGAADELSPKGILCIAGVLFLSVFTSLM
ncbi:Cell wall galactomannoprotein [Acrodontium crateriforme]|uniref:Cell wall galactomannoprotein n=1 Tax=Acrodontium crateriforme TaxID=150365 RepID=A0AAQ3RCV8_9PEZI|nr:Cell wall galactomannoprotein [Acrodontium crateriforme]